MKTELHIGFDARYIRVDHHDGISRFSARIGSELEQLTRYGSRARVTFIVCDERQLEHLPRGARHIFASSPTSVGERGIARALNRHGFDVVFSPMQTMGSRGRKFKLVLTVHDLIYYAHRMPPRQFGFLVRLGWRLFHLSWWPQRYLLNHADRVVTVSQATKRLIEGKRLTRHQVDVVYNGMDLVDRDSALTVARNSTPDMTLVYMGSFLPYKNVPTLIEVANRLPEYTLLLLSKIDPHDRHNLEKLITTGHVRFLDGVSDERYRQLLAGAHALVSASLDEGFGIPVLEAMAMGTPVICSDIPSFVEVGGEAPIYVDPHDSETFVSAVRSLDARRRSERSSAGLRQAAQFTWSSAARKLLDVLMDVGRP